MKEKCGLKMLKGRKYPLVVPYCLLNETINNNSRVHMATELYYNIQPSLQLRTILNYPIHE